jgi:hypothetical protein
MQDGPVADPTTREELITWLKTLQDQIYELRVKRFIFDTTWRLIQENPELQNRQSHIYGWLHDMYAEAMAMAIRRLCDPDTDTISLVRFLDFVKRDLGAVSRDSYAALFPEDTIAAPGLPKEARSLLREHLIKNGYDQTVGQDVAQPRGKDVRKEVRELTQLSESIIDYANKRIAHHVKTPPTKFPELGEINTVIDHATEIVQKYLLLLTATSTDMDVHFQYDWLAPFRVPWLPDRAVRNGEFIATSSAG